MRISASWSFTLQMWNCMKLKLAKTQTTICNLFTSHSISHELLVTCPRQLTEWSFPAKLLTRWLCLARKYIEQSEKCQVCREVNLSIKFTSLKSILDLIMCIDILQYNLVIDFSHFRDSVHN